MKPAPELNSKEQQEGIHSSVSFHAIDFEDPASFVRWNEALKPCHFKAFAYSFYLLKFLFAVGKSRSDEAKDLSATLTLDGRTVGVLPLFAFRTGREWKLDVLWGGVLPPLLASGLTEKQEKRCVAECFTRMRSIAKAHSIHSFVCGELSSAAAWSPWKRTILSEGYEQNVRHELYLELTGGMEKLRSTFRKSFRSLISSGRKRWKTEIVSRENFEAFSQYQIFQKQVVGKETRAPETWKVQQEAVLNNEAFAIYLRDPETSKMVGAGIFHHTCDEVMYSHGAYDRELKGQPLGHTVQDVAIEHMLRLGIRRYYLGPRFYPVSRPLPSEKEIQISYFKEGFASELRTTQEVKVAASPSKTSWT